MSDWHVEMPATVAAEAAESALHKHGAKFGRMLVDLAAERAEWSRRSWWRRLTRRPPFDEVSAAMMIQDAMAGSADAVKQLGWVDLEWAFVLYPLHAQSQRVDMVRAVIELARAAGQTGRLRLSRDECRLIGM